MDSATGAALLGAHYLRSGTADSDGAYCQGVVDELSRSVLVDPALQCARAFAGAHKQK